MKRLVALALLVGSLFFVPMGTANAAACEYALPQVPDDCVSQAVYEYVTGLQADDQSARVQVSNYAADNQLLRAQMWQQGLDLTAAKQATNVALGLRDAAYDQIDRLTVKVSALEAKVRLLKKRIKKLEAQLPRVAV